MGMRHIDSLDGLRAVAVSLVLAEHLFPTYVPFGGFGVDIFFGLSGYLITSLLLREFEETDGIRLGRFYGRRAARLMPALLLVLALVSIVRPGPEIWYAATYTMNWARALGWTQGPFLGHTWSLGVEEQYYFLWPLVLLAVMRCKSQWALLVTLTLVALSIADGIALYEAGASFDRIYNGADARAFELLLGSALAIYGPSHASWMVLPSNILSWAPLTYVGRISYGIYLWHYPVLRLAQVYGLTHLKRDVAVLAITMSAAAISYRFWECPIRRAVNGWLDEPVSKQALDQEHAGAEN